MVAGNRNFPSCFLYRTIKGEYMTHHPQSGHHDHGGHSCRMCSSSCNPEHTASVSGICHTCVYKILIVIFIIMISISYVAWFGVL
jgi:hypothetical protein